MGVFVVIQTIPFRLWNAGLLFFERYFAGSSQKSKMDKHSKCIDYYMKHSWFKGSTCMERALVKKIFFILRGIRSTICLGLKIEGDRLIAHAWMEHESDVSQYEDAAELFVRIYPSVQIQRN